MRKKTLEETIVDFNTVHNNLYDYSKTEYNGATTKVIIICPKHGEFEQIPNNHLSGSGCPVCGNIKTTRPRAVIAGEKFAEESNSIHDNKYDYSKVVYAGNQTNVIIICPTHGEFLQTPNNHKQGKGCKSCGYEQMSKLKIATNKARFIDRAKLTHGEKYDYSKSVYITGHTKLTITCPIHADFNQSPSHHIRGRGCPKCARVNNFPGYSDFYFSTNPQERNATGHLYIIKVFNDVESFIKVGITKQSIEHRTYELKSKGYSTSTMHEIALPLYKAYELEQHILNELEQYQYTPTIHFGGHTECIIESQLTASLIDELL